MQGLATGNQAAYSQMEGGLGRAIGALAMASVPCRSEGFLVWLVYERQGMCV